VIDGDTFDAVIEGTSKPVRIRVIGYDAPEKDERFGHEATVFVSHFLEGKQVLLEPDVQALDKYGRRLYYVYLPNVSLSKLLLVVGLGRLMTIPPNVKYVERLTEAQRVGMTIGLGVWSDLKSRQTGQRSW